MALGTSKAIRFRFGTFELDTDAHELRRSGQPVHVQPRVFSLIEYLVTHAGQGLSRETLLADLWDEAIVEDGSLSRAVRGARAALGADPELTKAIHTVRGFGYRFDAPVEPLASADANGSKAAGEARDHATTPFVGRDDALAEFGALVERVRDRRRGIGLVLGEPGIGKTTLVRRALDESDSPHVVGQGQSIEGHGAGAPYAPVLEALVGLTRSARGADQRAILAAIARAAPNWLGHLPLLFDTADPTRPAVELHPDQMAHELLDAIELIARDRSIVIWLEDLHWSDRSTLRLVEALASRGGDAQLLLICTARSTELATNPDLRRLRATLSRLDTASEIEIGPLSKTEIRRYVEGVVDAAGALDGDASDRLAEWLTRRTDGHPLFLSQLIQHLRTQGHLSGTVRDPVTARVLEEAGLPATLTELLRHWADDLDPDDRSLLEAGSVAGFDFDLRTIEADLERSRGDIERSCDRLCERGWLDFLGFETWPDGTSGARLRFAHALYAEALAAHVPPVRKSALHRRIAQRLESGHRDDAAHANAIALHYERAGDRADAARHRVAAAVHAASRQAAEEAIHHAERGLDELDLLELDEAGRDRAEFDLHMSLALALAAREGFADERAERHFGAARDSAIRRNDAELEIVATWGLSACLQMRGELDSARALAERLRRLAEEQGDPAMIQYALGLLTIIAYFQGRFPDCAEVGRAALDALGSRPRDALPAHAIQDTEVTVGIYAALSDWHLGRPEEGRALIETAYRRARSLGHPFTESLAEAFMAIFAYRIGDADAQREHGRRGRAVADAAGIPLWSKVSRFMEICANPIDEPALEELRATLAGMAGSGGLGGTFFIGLLADLELAHGSRENVRTLCTIGLGMAERTTENNNLPAIHLVAARVAEDSTERADHLARAEEWAERLGSMAFAEQVRRVRESLNGDV